MVTARLDAELQELRRDNDDLKRYILALQGEVYGARLAAKYLDKELAGRWVTFPFRGGLNSLNASAGWRKNILYRGVSPYLVEYRHVYYCIPSTWATNS